MQQKQQSTPNDFQITLIKLAGESAADAVLRTLTNVMNDIRSNKLRLTAPIAAKLQKDITTAYNVLNGVKYESSQERAIAMNKALDVLNKNLGSNPQYSSQIAGLKEMAKAQPYRYEEPAPVRCDANGLTDQQGEYIKFPTVDFTKQPGGGAVLKALGGWAVTKPIPRAELTQHTQPGAAETLVKANEEPWDLFCKMSGYIFHNNENIPSSEQLGLEPLGEEKDVDFNPKHLRIIPLNTQGGTQSWNFHRPQKPSTKNPNPDPKYLPPAIRIIFEPDDHNFWKVRDYIVKGDTAFGDARIGQGQIDIYELDAVKIQQLSKRLSAWGYGADVGPLNALLEKFTGKTYGQVEGEIAKKEKSVPLSVKAIQNGIDRNLGLDGHTKLITAGIPFDDEFKESLKYNDILNPQALRDSIWKDSTLPEETIMAYAANMVEAQQKAVHFMLTRQSSVEADVPGAGKTPITIAFADQAQKRWSAATGGKHSKILVFTPPQLLAEHWTTDTSNPDPKKHIFSKPAQYLGEKTQNPDGSIGDLILQVPNFTEFQKAQSDGRFEAARWIVVPTSAISQIEEGERKRLIQALTAAVNAKTFAASMADELQLNKSNAESIKDSSKTLSAMDAILSGSMGSGGELNLPHRVAMSGTPADNSPADIFSLMRAVRSPYVYNDKTPQQYQSGFVQQVMGMDRDALDKFKARSDGSQTEQGTQAYDQMFNWAKSTTPELRDANLRLFGTTFIRRTKKDMRPDMPPKAERKAIKVNLPKTWTDNLGSTQNKQMALAKVDTTVAHAIEYLGPKENTEPRMFIVSGSPEAAQNIANKINATLGLGTAAAVTGEKPGDFEKQFSRGFIAEAFKRKQDLVPGVYFRAAVYSQKVGAVGLNFKSAQRVVFNDFDWNPSMNLQTEDRIWRIDMPADQIAEVYYMVIDNTPDADKYDRVGKKEKLNARFHEALESITNPPIDLETGQAKDSQRMADDFTVDVVEELMSEFDPNSSVIDNTNTVDANARITLKEYMERRNNELRQLFSQQRSGSTPKARKPAPSMPAAPVMPSMPVAANWYGRLKIAMLTGVA
jgi:hypothetical protein